jgi:hypothetical protein
MTNPLAWWEDAVAGRRPAVTTEPQAGFFVVKAQGTMLPASITWEGPKDENGDPCGDEVLVAEIGGTPVDAVDNWLTMARRPVSRSEYSMWLDKLMETTNAQ